MLTTRTPEAHDWALKTFRTFRSGGQFYPMAIGQQTVVFPGFDGGAEWGGPAIDPVHDVIYINATEMAWTGGLVPSKAGSPGELVYQSQCAMCHGVDRAGSPPAFPSLVDIEKRMPAEKVLRQFIRARAACPRFRISKANASTRLSLTCAAQARQRRRRNCSQPPQPKAKPKAAADPAGAKVYGEQCAACHGDISKVSHPHRRWSAWVPA